MLISVSFSVNAQRTESEVSTQEPTELSCGSIIESEFLQDFEEHLYFVNLAPGDSIEFTATPVGTQLQLSSFLLDPNENLIAINSGEFNDNTGNISRRYLESRPVVTTEPLSARGEYTIVVTNFSLWFVNQEMRADETGGAGIYTLFIGCTLRDGTVIEPGNSLEDTADSGSDTSDTGTNDGASASAFSGFGLPALNAIDLSTVNASPLPADVPLSGSLAPDNAMVTAYSITANQGDTVQIDLSRVAGNLNLGVVIVDADGQPVFFSTLIANETLSEAWVAPSTGDYTAGVFPLIAILTDAPESTVFQISVVLNP
ncbi:MAG: hypothetical protein AAFV98_13680 [Chloroflexota bacterium]